MKKFNRTLSLVLTVLMLIMSLPVYTGAADVILDFSDLFNDDNDVSVKDDDKQKEDKPVVSDDIITEIPDDTEPEPDVPEDKTPETPDVPKEDEPVVYDISFSDVTEDKWFYEYVSFLAGRGIINGYEDGTFLPQNSITRAEFVKLLAMTMGYELTSTDEFEDVKSTDWFYTHVSAAVANGVIDKQDYKDGFKPNEKITRKEVAKLVVKAIGAQTGKYATPYVDTDDENVVALYAQCLMQGTVDDATSNRYFFPDSDITRAEISTVMSRLIEYNQDKDAYVQTKMAQYGMTELKLLGLPFFKQQYEALINDLGKNQNMFFVLENKDLSVSHDEISDNIIQAFTYVSMQNPETFSLMGISISKTIYHDRQIIRVGLESTSRQFDKEALIFMKEKAYEKAQEIINEIFDDKEFSDFEKARLIHNYLVLNTEYDLDQTDDAIYTSFGALINGKAVCQGYASAFNLLCKLSGVNAYAVYNDNHMWNAVVSEGQTLYYDATWDDPVPDQKGRLTENFCGVTQSVILKTHKSITNMNE